jgi:hypothetical protein
MRFAAVALLGALALPLPALAQDTPEILEIRETWEACTEFMNAAPDDWTGWRRNHDGGYSDHFEFHDGGESSVSVLVQTWLIDGIAIQKDTACYRSDGTLAFIFTELTSPNMAVGYDSKSITREGRLYFGFEGTPIRILGRITEDGEEVAKTDNEKYTLFRGCDLTQPHLTVDDVRNHQLSELGDIEGIRIAFEPNYFAWCNDPMLNK